MASDPASEKREQNARFKLGTLLQKERSERKSALVDQVVCSSISIEEKVNRILTIDSKPEEESPIREKPRAVEKTVPEREPEEAPEGESAGTEETSPRPPKPDSHRLIKRQKSQFFIEPLHGGLLRWFLKDLKRVRLFGEATDTIIRNTLPFTLRIDPKLYQWLQRDLQKILVPPLLDHLQILLNKSWLFLDKKSYNSIVSAQDLLLAIKRANFNVQGTVALRASINQFIGQFVYLLFDRDTLLALESAMDEAASRLAVPYDLRKHANQAFKELFRSSISSCTLENACLGIIMLHTHRFLCSSDLYRMDAKRLQIPGEAFECSAEVQKEIDHLIEKRFSEYQEIQALIQDSKILHAYLPAKAGSEKPDLDLSMLYQFIGPADNIITHNPALWAMKIHDRFREVFAPLLTDGPILEKGIRPRIFSKGLIQAQVSRMAMLMERLGKASTVHPEFSKARFDKLIQARHEAEPAELELLDIIVEYTSLLDSLGKNLADAVKTKSALAPATHRTKTALADEDLLPHEGDFIAQPPELGGKMVIEAIIMAVGMVLQASISLGNTELRHKWQILYPQQSQARDKWSDIERLASTVQLEALDDLINSPT